MSTPEPSDFTPPERPKIRLREEAATLRPTKPVDPTPSQPSPTEEKPKETAPSLATERKPATSHRLETITIPPGLIIWIPVGIAATLAAAALLSPATVVAGATVGIVVAASLGRLTGLLVRAKIPQRYAAAAATGIAVAALGVVMLWWMAVWQTQAGPYGAQLSAMAGKAAELADKGGAGEAGRRIMDGAHRLEMHIVRVATAVAELRVRMFFQFALFIIALGATVVLRPAEGSTGIWKLWGAVTGRAANLFSKIGFWLSGQIAKALAQALMAGIGLMVAGATGAWFIAGCVLVVALVLRSAPLVTVLMAVPMIAWGTGWEKTTCVVAGTGVVMFVAEKKLHWFLWMRPALAAGLIEPTVDGSTRGLASSVMQVVRVTVSLVCVALIAGLLWVFVPSFQERGERNRAITETELLLETNTPAATEKLLALAKRYPGEPELVLDLCKAYALAGDKTNALVYADAYTNWDVKAAIPGSLREKLYQKFLDLGGERKLSVNRAAGYEFVLRREPQQEAFAKSRSDLATKLFTINPDSVPALEILADESVLSGKADLAIKYAQCGLKLNPAGRVWHAVLADAYVQKQEWEKASAEADMQLAIDPKDNKMRVLRNLAERSRLKKTGAAP